MGLTRWLSNVERLDCIKVDVDGSEELVMAGMLELLRHHQLT